ncbi:MAG: hypothetical protein NT125_08890 [Candidatus Bipolaricaulota bacterium]|nr:hypothetical protein [Candidatus Bipolaricaulota bacterium]
MVYVKVVDPSHSGAPILAAAVKIGEKAFDLAPLAGAPATAYITQAITLTELGAAVGGSITATYTDPSDPTDTSSDTVPITSAELSVKNFLARPNPFRTETVFTYKGTGIAKTLSVTVYDLAGHVVWEGEASDTTELLWDGKDRNGEVVANGPYIYITLATDGERTFSDRGKVFVRH